MDTAVGKVSVHTVNLCQIGRTAYRTYIHLQFLMATVITVSQRKVYSFVISQIHSSADQCADSFFIISDRIADILDLSAIAEFPEAAFQILFLDRSHILCYMTVEAVAYIRTIGNAFDNTIHLTELFYLKTAETFCRCSVDCIEVSILFFELIYLIVDIFQYFKSKLSVLADRFAIVKLLQLFHR